jgi:hypothetical protein
MCEYDLHMNPKKFKQQIVCVVSIIESTFCIFC